MALHRLVFFMGGFDPKSPRFYHRLYREAAAHRPASPLGEQVQVGAREQVSPVLDSWEVHWQAPGEAVLSTQYGVMRWDDIVRRHWPRNLWQALRDYWHVYGRAGAQGMFKRVWHGSRAAFWLALFPLGVSSALLLACAAAAWAAVAAGLLEARWALAWVVPVWLLLWRGLESRLDSEWLLRLYGFTWFQAQDRVPELEDRIDALADALVQQAAQTEARELLVVGHSTGAMVAASVLARACQKAPWLGVQGPQLSLLTLGHCMPILAWLDNARRFRSELHALAAIPQLTWLDYSAPADWAAFARVPPWLRPGSARLLQCSPRFHQSMGPEAYQALLGDRHALHMQYLRAPRLAGGYDPVELTAGPLLLAERHARLTQPKR